MLSWESCKNNFISIILNALNWETWSFVALHHKDRNIIAKTCAFQLVFVNGGTEYKGR